MSVLRHEVELARSRVALGLHFVGKGAQPQGVTLQDHRLQAAVMVEVDVASGDHQVMVLMSDSGQTLGQGPRWCTYT
jgi:predicted HD phosphohydrolase